MLAFDKIAGIVAAVANANIKPAKIDHVSIESTSDSRGDDALRVTIVVPSKAASRLSGDAVLDTLTQVQDRLQAAGEQRFPIIHYATLEELATSGDP